MGVAERATGSLALGYLLPALGYVVVAVYGFTASTGPSMLEVEASPIV
jgi:hypothetical protein